MEHYLMKSKSIARFASVAALASMMPFGISRAHAVSSPTVAVASDDAVQPSQFQRVESNEEKKVRIQRAFYLLEHADSDYAGHRAKAMEHMKKAADILGIDLHGKAFPETDQLKSDERVRRARDLLQVMADNSSGKEAEHLRQAIHELALALAVK
jgi:hypothetical protein